MSDDPARDRVPALPPDAADPVELARETAGEVAEGVDNRFDALGALAFVALGLLVLVLAALAPKSEFTHDAIGPWAIPIGLAIALIALGLLQAVRSYLLFRRRGRIGPDEGSGDEPGYPAVPMRGLAFIGAGLAYPFLLPVLGFLLTTVPLIAFGLWALHFRRPAPLAIATLGFTATVYFLFVVVLSVRLPSGFLGWP